MEMAQILKIFNSMQNNNISGTPSSKSKIDEDWGSSDMSIALQSMKRDVLADINAGTPLTYEIFKDAAEQVGSFYYKEMGYPSYKEAADRLMYMWKIRKMEPEIPQENFNTIAESAPPDQESWIKKNKNKFKKQYGAKKGEEILYATAWKKHNKLKEAKLDETLQENDCQACSADGILPCQPCKGHSGNMKCKECVGTGEVNCAKCNGSGKSSKIEESVDDIDIFDKIGDDDIETNTEFVINSDDNEYDDNEYDESAACEVFGHNFEPDPENPDQIKCQKCGEEQSDADNHELHEEYNMPDQQTLNFADDSLPLSELSAAKKAEHDRKVSDHHVELAKLNPDKKYVVSVGDSFNKSYVIKSGDGSLSLTRNIDRAYRYDAMNGASEAKTDAVYVSNELGEHARVEPIFEALNPRREKTGLNGADKGWANSPNEQISGWKALIDDTDGLSKQHDQFHNSRGGDNELTVAANKKDEKLHENTEINLLALTLQKKFARINKSK